MDASRWLGFLTAVLLLAGCGSSPHAAPTTTNASPEAVSIPPTGLRVGWGLLQGAVEAIGSSGRVERPAPGTVTAKGASHVYTASVGDDGAFAVQVPAGVYTVTAKSVGVTCRPLDRVTVPPDERAVEEIYCDIGSRPDEMAV